MEYAQKNSHELVRLYADEGISGTKIRRRVQFQQMMADAERGLFEMLVVKDISRMARNTVDLLQSVRRLKALGIQTLFLTANMTSMGDSEFILTVFGALAQEESANMSKRVKFGKRANAEKGRVPNLVYGYDKTIGDYFNLTVNPKEAEIIRQIFDWYLREGHGGGRIADLLNRQGVKTKRGCAWSQNAVCRILTNPLYTGKVINGKQEISDFLTSARTGRDTADWLVTERPELRIISDEAFERAGNLMKSRGQMFRQDHTRHSNRYPFSTLIRCKTCGWSFRRVSRTYQNTYVRWVCSKHNGQGIRSCPNAASIDEGELLRRLDEYFQSLLQNRGRLERMLRQHIKKAADAAGAATGEEKELRARLAKLERQREKYLELYTEDLITKEELNEKLGAGKEETARLEARLDSLGTGRLNDAGIARLIRRVMENPGDFLSIRNLNNSQIKQLIDRIEVDEDENAEVYLRLCQATSSEAPNSLKGQPL